MNRWTPQVRALCLFASLIGIALLSGCGEKKPSDKSSARRMGKVEKAFSNAATTSGVPIRYLMAAAYVESRMAPELAYANYQNTNEDQTVQRGTLMTETAFGVRMEELGLDAEKAESYVLESQIEAYANWLSPQLAGLGLTDNNIEDKYYWIWNLAQLHREGNQDSSASQNVQILFARELIHRLNVGFQWQDPRNGELLELPPEKTPITIEKFSADGQETLRLFEIQLEIFSATHLPLATPPTGEFKNTPRRIEVVHCPLDLSGCLELMSSGKDKDVFLEAHYYIPPTKDVFPKAVQTVKHEAAIRYTNSVGEPEHVKDAVRIMLVGNSGRNVGGQRRPALPNWFSKYQLQSMGQLILEVCRQLAAQNESVDAGVCASTDKQNGVQFQAQQGEEFRWGDIADFDATIYESYISNPTALETGVAFEFGGGKKRFKAGSYIPLTVLIDPKVRRVELQRLERCADGRVVWVSIQTDSAMNEKKKSFKKQFYDSGPNQNGDQFFRARVSGADGVLMGWAIDQIHVHSFTADQYFASDADCRLN